MSRFHEISKRLVHPLSSRKVRVALTTVLTAYAAEYGLHVGEELILTILGVGVSLILGIAHEDAGRWSSGADGRSNHETTSTSSVSKRTTA